MNSTRAWLIWAVALIAYVVAVLQRTSFGVAGVEAAERFSVTAAQLSSLAVVQLVDLGFLVLSDSYVSAMGYECDGQDHQTGTEETMGDVVEEAMGETKGEGPGVLELTVLERKALYLKAAVVVLTLAIATSAAGTLFD